MFRSMVIVRPLSVDMCILHDAVSLYLNRYLAQIFRHSALLKRLSRSEVKDQGHRPMCTNARMLYNGGCLHFDGESSKLTCLLP